MKKNNLIAFILIGFLSACGGAQNEQKENAQNDKEVSAKEESDILKKQAANVNEQPKETATKVEKSKGLKYRSDGFHPGVKSEWLQIDIDKNKNIKSIFYWSTEDEKPIKLNIFKQNYSSGEISGFTAEIGFPDSPELLKLGLIEDKANLTWADGQFQEFEMEAN